jgi:hypothetical protein
MSWAARSGLVAFGFFLLIGGVPARAEEEVDLQLVLMVDASGSVDAQEYMLQRLGYAQAFRDPRVIDAILSGFRRKIAIALIEWTGPLLQVPIVDWTVLSDEASAAAFAARLETVPRILYGGGTSVGHAILYGAESIEANRFATQRRVIDVSGDGSNSSGVRPDLARDRVVARGFTVNGLPILTDEPYLDRYYSDNVIGGPGAFMVPARDFTDFAVAIRTKLIREIADTGAPDILQKVAGRGGIEN